MDFFLSKPIRRPALKHVLKTYCPPIPEEELEAVPSPVVDVTSSKQNGYAIQPAGSLNGKLLTKGNGAIPPTVANLRQEPESPAVSPLSRPIP
jgi:osomolarity two-component system sensor histidine kinase SLN1